MKNSAALIGKDESHAVLLLRDVLSLIPLLLPFAFLLLPSLHSPACCVKTLLLMLCGLPMTTNWRLRMYVLATRRTSAGVTARRRSRKEAELRQPPPMSSYCASSPACAALVSWPR